MTHYKNILFCTDFSSDAYTAFIHALELARHHDARLHIIHIPHSSYSYCKHIVDEHVPEEASGGEIFYNEEVEKKALEELIKAYGDLLADFTNYVFIIKAGSPYVEICRYARKNHIDTIVMGCLGKYERDHKIHGSTVDKVSKFAPCDVLTFKDEGVQGSDIQTYLN